MKQPRLFVHPVYSLHNNLLLKILEEAKKGVKVNYHWNGKAL